MKGWKLIVCKIWKGGRKIVTCLYISRKNQWFDMRDRSMGAFKLSLHTDNLLHTFFLTTTRRIWDAEGDIISLKNGHLLDMDFVCRQMLWKYIFTPIPNCLHMICNLVNFNSDIHLTPNFCCYKIIRQNICYIVLTDNTWIYISHLKTFDNIMLDHKDKSHSMLRHLSAKYKNKTFIRVSKCKNLFRTIIPFYCLNIYNYTLKYQYFEIFWCAWRLMPPLMRIHIARLRLICFDAHIYTNTHH